MALIRVEQKIVRFKNFKSSSSHKKSWLCSPYDRDLTTLFQRQGVILVFEQHYALVGRFKGQLLVFWRVNVLDAQILSVAYMMRIGSRGLSKCIGGKLTK